MEKMIDPGVQAAIAAAVYQTLQAGSEANTAEASAHTTTDATSTREVCTAIGDLLYELLSSRDTQGQLHLQGNQNQRSPWASKILTLRRHPGQN